MARKKQGWDVKPYEEVLLTESLAIRKFSKSVNASDLVWHRDRENRIVEVISGNGWHFQSDDCLPVLLEKGTRVSIPAGEYHRVIKGKDDLVIKIIKEKKKLSKKQLKIAKAAPPDDEITGADFKALNKEGLDDGAIPQAPSSAALVAAMQKANEAHHPDYGAPEGSKRDKQLDQTKKDLADAKELRKKGKAGEAKELEQRAYKRRERMEKKHRKNETLELSESELRELIKNEIEEALSAKVKKSLDKKAEKRGFTKGSVYKEFEKGLAAFASSGSRKGMSAHQWAHARVNSANPSKKWAVVKKSKLKKISEATLVESGDAWDILDKYSKKTMPDKGSERISETPTIYFPDLNHPLIRQYADDMRGPTVSDAKVGDAWGDPWYKEYMSYTYAPRANDIQAKQSITLYRLLNDKYFARIYGSYNNRVSHENPGEFDHPIEAIQAALNSSVVKGTTPAKRLINKVGTKIDPKYAVSTWPD